MVNELNFRDEAVTIIGGAGFSNDDLNACLAHGSTLISADGAVNNLDDNNYKVDYIIGDLDSLSDINLWENRGTQVMKIEEQDSTDFEKCLYTVNAGIYFCTGFIGQRSDHFLAVCSTLVNYHHKKIILLGNHDIIFHLPKVFEITLPLGTRLSLFPMQRILGISDTGLQWSISGIEFDPSKRVGTSNQTISSTVKINLSSVGMLIILPRLCFQNVVNAFQKL